MKALIALTDIRDQYEAWYTEGQPENFTTEVVDRETFDRMYSENMPNYTGMKIVDGCHMYTYQAVAQ